MIKERDLKFWDEIEKCLKEILKNSSNLLKKVLKTFITHKLSPFSFVHSSKEVKSPFCYYKKSNIY
jgi:hypothetical protein